MAEAVRRKRLSPLELVNRHIERMAAVNPRLNAITEVYESALEAARQATGRDPQGPLHGVPMTVKGAWDCEGYVNTGGTLGRQYTYADRDATVIARLRAAGAIPIAATNVPEFSFAFETDNLVYGRTNNPYDLEKTPGGSGGGGAAAIASGCSPFEAGGDMGGSIRWPCHCCGIAGLKPTLGRVPLTGYFPPPAGPVTLLATAGPMARYVDDLFPLLQVMAGPDGADANTADAVLRDPAAVDCSKLRIAWHSGNGILEPAAEIAAVVQKAAACLENVCAVVDHAAPPCLAESMELFLGILGADGGQGLDTLKQMSKTSQYSPLVEGLLAVLRPHASTGADFAGWLLSRDFFRSNVAAFFQDWDALVCPVNAFPALPHGTSVPNLASFSYTIAHNLSGCPAAVVRFGWTGDRLPIGVQVVAPAWREDIALAVAAMLEKESGGFKPPPL